MDATPDKIVGDDHMWTSLSAPVGPGTATSLAGTRAPAVLVVGGGARAAHAGLVLAAAETLTLRTHRPGEGGGGGRPDVVLVAVDQPAALEHALLEVRSGAGPARLVVLSEVDDPSVLAAAVRAGVDGWILPGTPAPEMVERLTRVAAGETGFCHVVTAMLVAVLRAGAAPPAAEPEVPPEPDPLTARERQVHGDVQAGRTIREIAQALSLSEVTVRWHATRAAKKLLRAVVPEPVPPVAAVVPAVAARALSLVPRPPRPVRPARRTTLSPAETRVAELVAQGLSNPQVAERLCISRHTVESHLKQIFAKLGVRSRVELTRALLTEAG